MQVKKIKNNDTILRTWAGMDIVVGAYYQVQPNEEVNWAEDSQLMIDIAAGKAIVNDGTSDITDVNDAINYIKSLIPNTFIIVDGVDKTKRAEVTSAKRVSTTTRVTGASTGAEIGNVGDRFKVDALASATHSGWDITKLIPIGYGESITAPAWPCKKPIGSYVVPAGKTFRLVGVMYKTAGASNYVHVYTRTALWKFSATALSTPGTPTLTTKTYSGAGMTSSVTYRYKITATNIMGETLPCTSTSIALGSTANAVYLSWTAVTNAVDYKIYRTVANGASGTEKFLQSTEATTFTDVSADSFLDTSTTPPSSNTTSGSSTASSYATDYAASEVIIDTLAPITTATTLDIVYKNLYGDMGYLTATPGTASGSQTILKYKGLNNPSDDRRHFGCHDHGSGKKGCSYEAGINDIVGVGNTPATGSFAIYGHNHLFHMASEQSNKWSTQYFADAFTFPPGSEIFFGVSSNTSLTTACRHDVVLLGVLE